MNYIEYGGRGDENEGRDKNEGKERMRKLFTLSVQNVNCMLCVMYIYIYAHIHVTT